MVNIDMKLKYSINLMLLFVVVVVRTALHWAAKRNHRQIVEFLLEHGADKDIRAHDKSTAAYICKDDSLRQILESSTSDSK